MKAIVATRFEPAVLELKTLRAPQPPGPGEVAPRVTKRRLYPGNLAAIGGRFNVPLPVAWFRGATAWASSKPRAQGWAPHKA